MESKPEDSGTPEESWAQRQIARGRILFPGLLAAVTVAIAARFLSEHYGGPTMLFALLLGMGFHFLSEEGACGPGIEFASRTVLQFGVALLGLGITLDQILAAGWGVALIVVAGIFVTLLSGPLLARLMKRGWRLGLLTGGAVAICGASATLAIATVLPKNQYSERNTIFTVISVTTLSTLAMIVYPMIVTLLSLDDFAAGVFIGATIHDVAQVVGAGYSISEEAGDTATFVKLLRVAMLVPIVVALSLIFRGDPTVGEGRKVPTALRHRLRRTGLRRQRGGLSRRAEGLAARFVALVPGDRHLGDRHEDRAEVAQDRRRRSDRPDLRRNGPARRPGPGAAVRAGDAVERGFPTFTPSALPCPWGLSGGRGGS